MRESVRKGTAPRLLAALKGRACSNAASPPNEGGIGVRVGFGRGRDKRRGNVPGGGE